MSETFALRARRVVAPSGTRDGAVLVRGGRILDIVGPGAVPAGWRVVEAGEAAVLPGLVDSHAHLNEPGRTAWEGFETGTAAAAAGGITTVVDMPLNSVPPTTSLAGLRAKEAAAEGKCRTDYALWGGVVPGNARELEPMVRAGVPGFKCFLIDSGVPEFPHCREADLREAMPVLARLGVPLLAHAELEGAPGAPPAGSGPRSYRRYLASRPRAWEDEAVALLARLCRETGCRVHVVHLSSADALPTVARAKAAGLPLTVETCPHYLTFAAEEVADGATPFKCAPPIREQENRERLWAAVASGLVDLVVSDHSPCEPALKRLDDGDFGRAWGGIASLQFSLPAVWTGMKDRGLGLDALARLMAAGPARLAGLDDRKGSLEPGKDADLLVFDPEGETRPEAAGILHRHPVTPYAGRGLKGAVRSVWLRGRLVREGERFVGAPTGRALARQEAKA